MEDNQSSRSVEILSVERTGGSKSNTWKVEFKTYEYTFYNKDTNINTNNITIIN